MASAIQVFSCPSCNETINTTMQHCAFCKAPIDAASALAAADSMSRINDACSDASYLKIVAASIGSFFIARFIPFLGMIGTTGFCLVLFATPFLTVRWWIKFGSIKTTDREYARARLTTLLVGGAAVLFIAAVILYVGITSKLL